jgi:hypothetical protein
MEFPFEAREKKKPFTTFQLAPSVVLSTPIQKLLASGAITLLDSGRNQN